MKHADADAAPAQQVSTPQCGLCKGPVQQLNITLNACGHSFCVNCIRPGVTSSNQLPLRCPVQTCSLSLHIDEVVTIAHDVQPLLEMVAFEYAKKNPDEYTVCPKAGCNQIIPRIAAVVDRLDPEVKYHACTSCGTSYCLTCSKAANRAVEHHEGDTCMQQPTTDSYEVEHHVQIIRVHVLTLSCPLCQNAFLDFDGCLSVACGNVTCARFFCGACLAFSDLDSKITHDHVKKCLKNPVTGGLYVSAAASAAIHLQHREEKLREYTESKIQSDETRRAVLERVANDLRDLELATVRVKEEEI